MRKSLLWFLALLVACTTLLGSASAQDSKRVASVNWLQRRHDNQHSGFNPYETQITPESIGRLHATHLVPFAFSGFFGPRPPLVYRGTLFTVAISFNDPETDDSEVTTVYAMDPATGRIKWTRDVDSCHQLGGEPAISAVDNVIVIAMGLPCGSGATGEGRLIALDLGTREIRWISRLSSGSSSPTIAGGSVYVATRGDGLGTWMGSFDTATGAMQWMVDGDFGAPSVGAGIVYAPEFVATPGSPGFDRKLTALDAVTGARLWTVGSGIGAPTIGGGRIFVACDAGVCAFNRAGAPKWSYAGGSGEVAYANGSVYMGCEPTAVCAVDARTGLLRWSLPMFNQPLSFIVAGGIVYASTGLFGGVQRITEATGADLGSFFPSNQPSSPVVVNGRIYLISENRLYIYELM